MLAKTVLLIIASEGYQVLEYGDTRTALEQQGINVEVASDKKGTAQSNVPKGSHPYATAQVDLTLAEVQPGRYDGIFVVGGPGALEHLDNNRVIDILRQAYDAQKVVGAICVSPRILARAGLLTDKKATGWNDDGELPAIFKQYKVTLVSAPVVVDGRVITASGPRAAKDFGRAIVQALKGSQ